MAARRPVLAGARLGWAVNIAALAWQVAGDHRHGMAAPVPRDPWWSNYSVLFTDRRRAGAWGLVLHDRPRGPMTGVRAPAGDAPSLSLNMEGGPMNTNQHCRARSGGPPGRRRCCLRATSVQAGERLTVVERPTDEKDDQPERKARTPSATCWCSPTPVFDAANKVSSRATDQGLLCTHRGRQRGWECFWTLNPEAGPDHRRGPFYGHRRLDVSW